MALERDPLDHFIYVNLSAKDRRRLEEMADERGATLSGVVRKLIRDASRDKFSGTMHNTESLHAASAR